MTKFCKTIGCINVAAAKGLCPACLSRKHGIQKGYCDRTRVPRRIVPPHGFLTAEIEYSTDTETAYQACLNVFPSHYDSSVNGGEYKLTRHCERIGQLAAGLVRRAYQCGARANSQCGFHVHVDVRGVPLSRIRSIRDWVRERREQIMGLFPESRHGGQYCQYGSWEDRYSWVNYRSSFETIEWRCHPGTLHPSKAYGWLEVCNQLGDVWRGPNPLPQSITGCLTGFARDYWLARQRNPSLRLGHPDAA